MDIEIKHKKDFTQVIDRTLGCKGIYYFPKMKANTKNYLKILKEIFPYHKFVTLK